MTVSGASSDEEPNQDLILVMLPLTVADFSEQLGLKPFQLIRQLMEIDVFLTQGHQLDERVLVRYGEQYGVPMRIVRREL